MLLFTAKQLKFYQSLVPPLYPQYSCFRKGKQLQKQFHPRAICDVKGHEQRLHLKDFCACSNFILFRHFTSYKMDSLHLILYLSRYSGKYTIVQKLETVKNPYHHEWMITVHEKGFLSSWKSYKEVVTISLSVYVMPFF